MAYITDFRFQNKILTGADVIPTIPSPVTANPDSDTWVDATDIMQGEIAYNQTDDIWYYRTGADVIQILAVCNEIYWGDPGVEGTWRMIVVDGALVTQLYTSGVYEIRQRLRP